MRHNGKLNNSRTQVLSNQDVLFLIGEELKRPLSTIKLLAESQASPDKISLEAKIAMKTLDYILLFQRISHQQQELQLEPVHIGSALTAVKYDMEPISLQRGCETEIYVQSGVSAVDANRQVLRSAIESLWQAAIGLTQRPSPIRWHIYNSSSGIRLVVTNNSIDMKDIALDVSKTTPSKQTNAGLSGPATDLLTAQGMFGALGTTLRKTRIDGLQGISVTLPHSQQLTLV